MTSVQMPGASAMALLRAGLALILISPVAFTLWARYSALRADPTNAANLWLNSRRTARAVRLIVVALWWAGWDLQSTDFFASPSRLLLFWIPPILSIGISQSIAYCSGRDILRLKWRFSDIVRLTFWSTMSPTVALIGVATGAEAIYRGWWQGTFLLAVSGIVAFAGSVRLRSAEGLQLRPLSLGKLHGRAFQLAKKMSVKIENVYIVPGGKGHLTNAYGLWRGIALTDNYGEFTNKSQLDFVIGHELMHVKQRHGRKQLAVALGLFLFLTLVTFNLPPLAWRLRAIIDVLFLLVPSLALYFVSRRFEYAADRGSVEYTSDPESAIRALENLHRLTSTPSDCGRIVELFQSHPALSRRAAAIASIGDVPSDRVNKVLGQSSGTET
jgi:Zn-dependent protease with chaperone function